MRPNSFRNSLIALTIALSFNIYSNSSPAQARSGDFEVKTGQGEEFTVQHNLFGRKSFVAQDRLGNKVERSKGLLGNDKTGVQILGNGYETKKSIFGNKSTKVSTILGDKVETKKSWFGLGRRKTTVDLSGTTSLINSALSKRKGAAGAPNDLLPSANLNSQPVPNAETIDNNGAVSNSAAAVN
ncbi:hypothetical protein BH11CYA1_BH11CYA1_09740 [soil metagenome]